MLATSSCVSRDGQKASHTPAFLPLVSAHCWTAYVPHSRKSQAKTVNRNRPSLKRAGVLWCRNGRMKHCHSRNTLQAVETLEGQGPKVEGKALLSTDEPQLSGGALGKKAAFLDEERAQAKVRAEQERRACQLTSLKPEETA